MLKIRLLLVAFALASCVAIAAPASAAPPTYLFLTGPAHDAGQPHPHPHPRHQAPASYGYVEPVNSMPYAYGWFGACPRQHWVRSFGILRDYTQWQRQ